MLLKSKFLLIVSLACIFLSLPQIILAAPTISNVTDNRSTYTNSEIPKFSKFELTFDISTIATQLQHPYDPTPPAGLGPGTDLDATSGITVAAEFINPSSITYAQPAFYYTEYQSEIREGQAWNYPTGNASWKVRFSPNTLGTWQYRITATDASGTQSTSWQTMTVTDSSNPGFVRVSKEDPRYFEFENGDYFPGLGYNETVNLSDPAENAAKFQTLSQTGLNFIRLWMAPLNIYGSSWMPYLGQRNQYNGYIPRPGLLPFEDRIALRIDYEPGGDTGWFDACRQLWGNVTDRPTAVKPNTNYELKVTYRGVNITGPRNSSYPQYGLVARTNIDQQVACHDAGHPTSITNHGTNNTDWTTISGTWNSSTNNFLPPLFFTLENVNSGQVYISEISLKEVLPGNQRGPEIIQKPSMAQHLYFEQHDSYQFDKVLDLAAQNDIYLKLVIEEKNELIFAKTKSDGNYIGPGEDDDFTRIYGNNRQIDKVRWLQQSWWRYLQARWGYSPNVQSWEFVNEGDPVSSNHYATTDELGKYMRCTVFGNTVGSGDAQTCTANNPNAHLVSTSFWHSFPANEFWKNANYPNVDYANVHAYISTSQVGIPQSELIAMQDDAALYHYRHSQELAGWNIGKPIIRGESGMDAIGNQDPNALGIQQDTTGVWFHNFLWSQLDPGGLIESYFWKEHLYNSNYDHRSLSTIFSQFIQDIPLQGGGYDDIAASSTNAQIVVLGQFNADTNKGHLWIKNKNYNWKNAIDGINGSPASTTITIPNLQSQKTYKLTWYDTWTGQQTSTQNITANANGQLIIDINELTTDTALKISTTLAKPAVSSPGDANSDNTVNVLDFQILSNTFSSSSDLRADFNTDFMINILDYQILANNFGS